MKVLSNAEFEKLVEGKASRLRAVARKRCDSDPQGHLHLDELDRMIQMFAYSGDGSSSKFLKDLRVLATSGEIKKARSPSDGKECWESHVRHVAMLHKRGEVAFNLFDHIMLKEDGKRGMVVDYLPDDKTYVVALNPFELRSYPKGDLEKVATKVDPEE